MRAKIELDFRYCGMEISKEGSNRFLTVDIGGEAAEAISADAEVKNDGAVSDNGASTLEATIAVLGLASIKALPG